MKVAQRNTLLYGIYGFLCIGAFFLLMRVLQLHNVTELRLFNVVILIVALNMLSRKNVRDGLHLNYIEMLGSMLFGGIIMAALTTISFIAYIKIFDEQLLSSFKNRFIADGTFNVYIAGAILMLEGFASTLAVSFISMQYWKRYENQME
jgi:hypothetical protein